MAADVSFDDLIPKQKETGAKASSDVSFDDLIPASTKAPQKEVGSTLHNVFRTAGESVAPTAFGLAGFGAGMSAAAPVAASAAAVSGPFAPAVGGAIALAGGLGGAFVGSGAAQKVQNWMHELFAPQDFKQRQIEKQQHPTSTFLTGLGVGLLGQSPKALAEVPGKILTKPIVQRAASAGLMGGIEAGTELVSEGKVEPWKVGASMVAGAAMPGFNPVGEKLVGAGRAAADLFKKSPAATADLPPRPDPKTASPDEIANFKAQIKERVQERLKKVPLVETAIRNKETGEIERMGPKHDEARKLETADTHEQGFVDEKGNFLNRKEAWERAKTSGQIPEGQQPEIVKDGLHSGDLRKAGVKAFEITEEQPAGVPSSTKAPKAPTTRQEYKEHITNLEDKLLQLEAEHINAPAERKSAIDAEQAKIKQDLADAHKAMPAAKIADKTKVSSQELHDVLWGTKNMGEALDRLISEKLGRPDQLALAKAFNRSNFIRSATLQWHKDRILGANGEQHPAVYRGGDLHHVDMGLGSGLSTLLHEGGHAATVHALEAALTDPKKRGHARELVNLFEKHKAELDRITQDMIANASPKGMSAERIAQHGEYLRYGLTDVKEFVSEALTNKGFQKALSKITSDGKPASKTHSLWKDFKNAVGALLGRELNLTPEARTALDDVLDHSIGLIEKTKDHVISSTDLPPSVSPSRLSQEIHDQLEAEGIAVAHASASKFDHFDWIRNALKGAGSMVKGAGTYFSTKDSTNKGYIQMSKDALWNRSKQSILQGNNPLAVEHRALEQKLQALTLEHDKLLDRQIEMAAKGGPQYDQLLDENRVLQNQKTAIRAKQKDLLDKLKETVKATVYHSTLRVKPEELIDWDNAKQSDLVKKVFSKFGIETKDTEAALVLETDTPGEWFLHDPSDPNGQIFAEITRMDSGEYHAVSHITGEEDIFGSFLAAEQWARFRAGHTGESLYKQLSEKLQPSLEDTKQKYAEIFPNDISPAQYKIDKLQKHLGDVKASLALAEQGVVGNKHAGQGATEHEFPNYVLFDDSRAKINFVEAAAKIAPEEAGTEPLDRTKTDPRDVKSKEEFLEIATDIYEKHGDVEAVKFFEGYKAYQETWKHPLAEVEKFVGINIRSKLANERIIHNTKQELVDALPDAEARVRVAEAIDTGKTASLTPAEKAVADKYSALVKDIGERAKEKGVIRGLLENYVTHIVNWEGAPPSLKEELMHALFSSGTKDPSMAGMAVTSKFGKTRKLPTFAELEAWLNEANSRIEASGKTDFRLKLKTKDIAEIYKEYALSMEKAIENKKLIDSLKQVRNPAGEAWVREVTPENPLTPGYTTMAAPQLSGYAVHENMVPALKFVFDAGPGDLMKALGAISNLTKRFNVIGSFFHAKSLMEVMSSAKIPLWTPIKEGIVLPLAEQAGKAVGKDLQLSAITKAVNQFKEGGVGSNVDMWIRDAGLKLDMPEDVGSKALSQLGAIADKLIGKFGPKTRALESSLSTVEKYTLGLFDQYTWNYLHTGGKLMVADAYLEKARIQHAKQQENVKHEASKISDEVLKQQATKAAEEAKYFSKEDEAYTAEGERLFKQKIYDQTLEKITKQRDRALAGGDPFDEIAARKQIASFVNDSFGGLNWFDIATQTQNEFAKRMSMAAYSPQGRRALQAVLFAPDWTISTLRAFSAALPEKLNPKEWHPVEGIKGMAAPTTKADYARLYQFKTALLYLTLLNGINMMTANRPIWENKDKSRIEWPDGTSMQAMKHAMEPYHWVTDPTQTLMNKIGFIPKAAFIIGAGTEYASPSAPKLVDRGMMNRVMTAAKGAYPFQIQAAKTAPEGEGVKRALLGTAGFPVYGSTPEQKKLARTERNISEKELSWEYHEKEIQAGREKRTKEHDNRGRMLRRRRQKLEAEKGKE